MATVKGNSTPESIDPVIETPQPQGVLKPAENVRYMPPTSQMAKKGTFMMPSGNKVTNA